MQITISDKVIAKAVGYVVDGSVYEYFDAATHKAAGIGKRADMIKATMADPKFQTKLAKMIAQNAEDLDQLTDFIYDLDSKIIVDSVIKCEEVYDEVHAEERRRQQEMAIRNSIATLESLGYKVTKA